MPANPQTQPTSVRIKLTTGEGVEIDWADGHHSHYAFDFLRVRCPCATCRTQREKPPLAGALPLYQEKVSAAHAEPVGHYAVRFTFSDGHSTGIYSFDYFREICPCADCAARRTAAR